MARTKDTIRKKPAAENATVKQEPGEPGTSGVAQYDGSLLELKEVPASPSAPPFKWPSCVGRNGACRGKVTHINFRSKKGACSKCHAEFKRLAEVFVLL